MADNRLSGRSSLRTETQTKLLVNLLVNNTATLATPTDAPGLSSGHE